MVVTVVAHKIDDAAQVAGINSPVQLAELERAYQLRQAKALMEQGVRLADPARFDLRGSLACGQDVEIDINCIFAGQVSLGAGVKVGAHCVISNASIADGAVIHPFTHIDGEKLGVICWRGCVDRPVCTAATWCQNWAKRCISATLSKLKTQLWPMAPKPTIWRIWAMPRWASGLILALAASPPTMMARTNTAR